MNITLQGCGTDSCGAHILLEGCHARHEDHGSELDRALRAEVHVAGGVHELREGDLEELVVLLAINLRRTQWLSSSMQQEQGLLCRVYVHLTCSLRARVLARQLQVVRWAGWLQGSTSRGERVQSGLASFWMAQSQTSLEVRLVCSATGSALSLPSFLAASSASACFLAVASGSGSCRRSRSSEAQMQARSVCNKSCTAGCLESLAGQHRVQAQVCLFCVVEVLHWAEQHQCFQVSAEWYLHTSWLSCLEFHRRMGNWMYWLYCLIREFSLLALAMSAASSFRCSVMRVPLPRSASWS